MKYKSRQAIALAAGLSLCANIVFASNLGLEKANIISTALDGVCESTPEENIFTYEEIYHFYDKKMNMPTNEIKQMIKNTLENCQIKRYGRYYVFLNKFSKI